MTTQERINSLAAAALQSDTLEKPAIQPGTVLPVPEKAPTPVVAEAPVKKKSVGDLDEELNGLIETREKRMKKRRSVVSKVVTACILAVPVSAATYVTVSPTGRQQASATWTAIKESKGDIRNLSNIVGTYNKQLKTVAVQSARVDAATRALGVDPTKEVGGNPDDLNDQMRQMSGGGKGGPTTLERNEKVREKFGIIGKLGGSDPNKLKEGVESDVKF